MAEPKLSKTKDGEPMHYSVGALIVKDGKYLLIDRAKPPFGFSGVAGHIDEGEDDPVEALKREIKEESGLDLTSFKLLFEEEHKDTCRRGIQNHYWYFYECAVEGEVVWNQHETKSIGWYEKEDLKKITFEPAWVDWIARLGLN